MAIKRGKDRIPTHYGLKDIYKYYKNNVENPLSHREFKRILTLATSIIMHKILEESFEFIIPARLGSMRIRSTKLQFSLNKDGSVNTSYLKPDFQACWRLWRRQYPNKTDKEISKITGKKVIYHLNEHTNQYYNRFYWDKITCNVKNQVYYAFAPTRKWKEILTLKSKQKILYYE